MPAYTIFSFYRSADHRDLHSFPTRRSSDLDASLVHTDVPGKRDVEPHPAARVYLFAGTQHTPGSLPPPDADRSEEHTSELQSHSDLVCRLLLEKKKKQSTMTSPTACAPSSL